MQCCNCDNEAVHMHHVVPRAKGGSDRPSNLVPLCANCHALVHGVRATCNPDLIKAGLARRKAKGLPTGQPPKWSKEQLEKGVSLYRSGKTLYEAASESGVPKSTLYRYIQGNGTHKGAHHLEQRLKAAYAAYANGATIKEACRLHNVAARTFRKYREPLD